MTGGLRGQGLGFRVWGSGVIGFRLKALGCAELSVFWGGLGFRTWGLVGLGFKPWDLAAFLLV